MGHVRLGRLPHTLKWREVVGLLTDVPSDSTAVATATIKASEEHLDGVASDPSLVYCFWLLSRVTWAARTEDFVEQLTSLGVSVRPGTSILGFFAGLADHAREHMMDLPESGPVSELASQAMRHALTQTVGAQGASLFGSTIEDLQSALKAYSTRERFAYLSQQFFADFLSRTLRSYVDRALPNLVGKSAGINSITDSREVLDAIDRHARETSVILRDFSGGWYSKHNWESRGEISLREAEGFVGYALRKMRDELKREAVR